MSYPWAWTTVGIDCGNGGGVGWAEEDKGKNWDNCNRIKIKN